MIEATEIESVLGQKIASDTDQLEGPIQSHGCPGRLFKHYAPLVQNIELVSPESLADAWHADAALLLRESLAVALLEQLGPRQFKNARIEALPDEPEGFSQRLYAALYRLEMAGPSRLLIEKIPKAAVAWTAISDRLHRAASAD